MVRCECYCVCCDTQVFLLPGMSMQINLFCSGCGRMLRPMRLEPFDEREWLTCREPHVLVQYHRRGQLSERKRRLFLCACCRLVWQGLTKPRSRRAVEVAERFADGLATRKQLAAVYRHADAVATADEREGHRPVSRLAAMAAGSDPDPREAYPSYRYLLPTWAGENEAAVCALYRDITGNPFRPAPALDAFVLAWGDGVIGRLARGIEEEQAYQRLPILADALEDAVCTSAEVLEHCRSGGLHARGCWVVDLILGKE